VSAACWSCGATFIADRKVCPLCEAAADFGSAPALINEAEELVRKLDGVLAHLENSARKHEAVETGAAARIARRFGVNDVRDHVTKLREALRVDGNGKQAA